MVDDEMAVKRQITHTIEQSSAETDSAIIKERSEIIERINEDSVQVVYRKAAELEEEQKDFCGSQLQAFYKAGQRDGWIADGEKEYMEALRVGREEDSFYLVVQKGDTPSADILAKAKSCFSFALFKYSFDWEDDEEADDPEALLPIPCLYIYQLHTLHTKQGMGYGSLLLGIMEDLAIKYGFPKLKLTVLKGNERAAAFYLKNGFSIDCTDPSNYDFEPDDEMYNCSYSIFSKTL